MIWRFINLGAFHSTPFTAYQEALSKVIKDTGSNPVFMICQTPNQWLTLPPYGGDFHNEEGKIKLKDIADEQYCKDNNIDFERRLAGGGVAYIDINCPVFNLIVKDDNPIMNKKFATQLVQRLIVRVCRELGVQADPRVDHNDVLIKGKKVSGIGISYYNNCLIASGTLILDMDFNKAEKAMNKKFRNVMTTLNKETNRDIAYDEVVSAYRAAIKNILLVSLVEETNLSPLEQQEFSNIQAKYESKEWREDGIFT